MWAGWSGLDHSSLCWKSNQQTHANMQQICNGTNLYVWPLHVFSWIFLINVLIIKCGSMAVCYIFVIVDKIWKDQNNVIVHLLIISDFLNQAHLFHFEDIHFLKTGRKKKLNNSQKQLGNIVFIKCYSNRLVDFSGTIFPLFFLGLVTGMVHYWDIFLWLSLK